MTIAKSQLTVLRQKKFMTFIDKMIEFVLDNFSLNINRTILRDEIFSVVQEAESYGFEDEETIEQYIFLKWEYPEFKKHPLIPEMEEILTYPDRESQKKIDELILLFEDIRKP